MPVDEKGDITGNAESIQAITNYLTEILDNYLREHPATYIDVFMAAHNFHKKIVDNIAKKWAIDGFPLDRTYRLADMTFRSAIRELKRR